MCIDSTNLVLLKHGEIKGFSLKVNLNLTDLDGTLLDAENVEIRILLKGGL